MDLGGTSSEQGVGGIQPTIGTESIAKGDAMNTIKKTLSVLAGASTLLGTMATAHASDEYHLILLHRTGSMGTTVQSDLNTDDPISRWKLATTLASNWVV